MLTALTGATGFLSLHLLGDVMDNRGTVVVLARGGRAATLRRIGAFLATSGRAAGAAERLLSGVRVVPADVTQPRLGLTRTDHDALADLWQSAADTTMDSGLDRLRLVNIGGTGHTPALAAAGRRRHPALVPVSAAFMAGRRR